jgi:hypothetical protein
MDWTVAFIPLFEKECIFNPSGSTKLPKNSTTGKNEKERLYFFASIFLSTWELLVPDLPVDEWTNDIEWKAYFNYNNSCELHTWLKDEKSVETELREEQGMKEKKRKVESSTLDSWRIEGKIDRRRRQKLLQQNNKFNITQTRLWCSRYVVVSDTVSRHVTIIYEGKSQGSLNRDTSQRRKREREREREREKRRDKKDISRLCFLPLLDFDGREVFRKTSQGRERERCTTFEMMACLLPHLLTLWLHSPKLGNMIQLSYVWKVYEKGRCLTMISTNLIWPLTSNPEQRTNRFFFNQESISHVKLKDCLNCQSGQGITAVVKYIRFICLPKKGGKRERSINGGKCQTIHQLSLFERKGTI